MYNRIILFIVFVIIPPALSTIYPQGVTERTPFAIPLIKLRIQADDEPGSEFKKVIVPIRDDNEYAIITRYDDLHIKNTRKGREKTTYAEIPAYAGTLSDFEKIHLERVVHSLIETLTLFERDLETNRLDKCLYLDSFFPRFMRCFYYLNCAAFNSMHALPPQTLIPDHWYDVSLRSEKAEKRIHAWQGRKDHPIKLRIAARELTYQLKTWQKKNLIRHKETIHVELSQGVRDAYSLFVKLYFIAY